MAFLSACYIKATILLSCILLGIITRTSLVAARRTCNRKAPESTDCSAATGECNLLFDKDSTSNTLPRALPFPPPNTRTCFRTCFEDGICKSFISVVDEQPLRIDELGANFKVQRIFSPRYGSGNYRKSTNCRYSVKCEPGQLLSYSVHEFNLEPKSTCSNQLQCIDYVEIRFRNLETKPRFCGSGEVGEVHVDGSNEMTFEFASNRQTEKGGFLYFVTCTDPGFDQNAVDFGVVPRSKKPADININACSAPLTRFQRPTFIQPPSGIFDPTPRRFVVRMSGSIFYRKKVIWVRDGRRVLKRIRGITRLEVANRFTTAANRHYPNRKGQTFYGYGTLQIRSHYACFYQVGADPIFQPSPEEAQAILKLERAINTILGDDFFDVVDKYDLIEDPTVLPTLVTLPITLPTLRTLPIKLPTLGTKKPFPTTGPVLLPPLLPRFKRRVFGPINIPQQETALASQYGNACNAILRATACTYQALIMGTDCNTGLSLI